MKPTNQTTDQVQTPATEPVLIRKGAPFKGVKIRQPGTTDTSAEAPKHTPGPWQICPGGGFIHFTAVNGEIVAKINPNKITTYDARLIAAAPELLAALKKYANFVQESGRTEKFDREAFVNNMLHATDLARAAIARAEGSTT